MPAAAPFLAARASPDLLSWTARGCSKTPPLRQSTEWPVLRSVHEHRRHPPRRRTSAARPKHRSASSATWRAIASEAVAAGMERCARAVLAGSPRTRRRRSACHRAERLRADAKRCDLLERPRATTSASLWVVHAAGVCGACAVRPQGGHSVESRPRGPRSPESPSQSRNC